LPTPLRATGAPPPSPRSAGWQDNRARLEHTENALQRALSRQILRYEASMIFLASIVTGAPFLGLLGTVWGVMESFSAVSTPADREHPDPRARHLVRAAHHHGRPRGRFRPSSATTTSSRTTKRLITELENYASSLADRIELESK
jgi:biopolymer transport protein TolQ